MYIHDRREDDTHVKAFYTAKGPFQSLLALPGQLLFAIAGLFGFAHYARQIVHVSPRGVTILRTQNGADVAFTEWVRDNVRSLQGRFVPTWWLPSGHLQTMFSVVGNFSKVDQVEYKRTYLRVPDGGTLGLDFTPKSYDAMPEDTPTIVACHGLTGGSHESYVRNILAWVIKPRSEGGLGGRAVVINFRGCAGVPATSPQFYSAGTTVDLALSLHYLRNLFPHSPLHGIGFSLGASVLSRYLGETGDQSLLSSGVVLGTPWDLPKMSIRLESHWFISRVYSKAMAQNLLRVLFSHYDRNPELFEDPNAPTAPFMPELKRQRKAGNVRLKKLDEHMVSRFGGPQNIGLWPFSGADEYYNWASPKHVIKGVKRPTLAINAFDDPIIDGASLPIEDFAGSSHVYAAISGGGGHLGWFEGSRANDRWVKKPVSEWFIAATRDLSIAGDHFEVERDDDGWTWIPQPAHKVAGIGGPRKGMVGWKVLKEGEDILGAEGEGPLQGL